MKLLLLGDICPTNDYRKLFDDRSANSLLGEIKDYVFAFDYAICNLECPVNEGFLPTYKCGPTLSCKKGDIELIKNAGFYAVSLANNHILDYGEKGLNETVKCLNDAGLKFFGVKKDGKETGYITIKSNGETVHVISFAEEEFNSSPNGNGARVFDPYTSFDEIKNLSKTGKVICLYHGGIEYYRYPTPLLKLKCEKMIDAGASLVLCQHSHIIGTECDYNGGKILYGQGNFVFGVRKDKTWNNGLAVCFDTEKNETSYRVLLNTESGVRFISAEKEEEILKDIICLSEKINDENFIRSSFDVLCEKKKDLYFPMVFGAGRIANKLNRITKGKVINLTKNKKKKMTTLNLIRCDAHGEIVKNILKKEYEK